MGSWAYIRSIAPLGLILDGIPNLRWTRVVRDIFSVSNIPRPPDLCKDIEHRRISCVRERKDTNIHSITECNFEHCSS